MSRYLITFDMDTNCLKDNYHSNSWNNAYIDIKNILYKHGFDNIQGSVYLGHEGVSEAHGTIAIQEVTAKFDWFHRCVSNVKFYRLESDLDAQFIIDSVVQAKQAFLKGVEQLKESLEQAGLSEQQINKVLEQQRFNLEELPRNSDK
ncbi:MAG: VapD [Proteobacteria bacterium]|nr:MAG: VapD [Pseudomonadota bacterium]